ncbi:NAD-P-binding protein [Vararia minispora EC-137]|uniref:NAD-P-binding protein n=1 Tax=Vararia minispora EC-137 TaxID=1314806 RepID=A0ACB8QEZ7_9AGAM|nr:NAD-P-binding protein [Vararia minispora EC-137]
MSSDKTIILITGCAGWLASLLIHTLLADPDTPNCHLILADVVQPTSPVGAPAIAFKADLTDTAEIEKLFTTEFGVPDIVYALHGIMSRGAEDNFDLGLKVNIDSVRMLLDAARHYGEAAGKLIKFIFTSSLAVYGGPLPEVVTPNTIATPESAYGMAKLASELAINEYSRRGLVDGRVLRLPTIVVRPGPPAAATSAFLSGIIREPLKGTSAVCPIGTSPTDPKLDALHTWLASPHTTVSNLVHASHIPASRFLRHTRVVCLPGFTASVRELLDALAEVAGPEALELVRFEDDAVSRKIVGSWPARFDDAYARELGFVGDEGGMVPIVRRFKEDVEAGRA